MISYPLFLFENKSGLKCQNKYEQAGKTWKNCNASFNVIYLLSDYKGLITFSETELPMKNQWKYQIRIVLNEERAKVARQNPYDASLNPLGKILTKHNASLKCQYDAFSEYCAMVEKSGDTDQALYRWTKDTLADPKKVEKFVQSFTFYLDDNEVYEKHRADLLEGDLTSLVKNGPIESIQKHDTNPSKNPQPPSKYLKSNKKN